MRRERARRIGLGPEAPRGLAAAIDAFRARARDDRLLYARHMRSDLVPLLRCPVTSEPLSATGDWADGELIEGGLVTPDGSLRYPVHGGIPRFAPSSNYADGFGMQWNRFRRTQLDSATGRPISATRFWAATGLEPSDLHDRWVLDAGCGAGRFAEVALAAGAHVVALDYSNAVDACATNLGPHPRLHPVQGDLRALPFAPGTFDVVYSLGVLQHTPDPRASLIALASAVRPGGRLCVDIYFKTPLDLLHPRRFLRPVTRRLDDQRLLRLVERCVPTLLALAGVLGRVPGVGRALRRAVPVADYRGVLDLDDEQQFEWSVLDTFDWLSPRYDQPQTARTLRRWMMEDGGLEAVETLRVGPLVGRGVRPVV